jgi:carboxymethylenebutenolidase
MKGATACPIVAGDGAKHRWNQGVAEQHERVLQRTFIVHDVKEHPDAGHSFLNDHQSICFKAQGFGGMGYNRPATLDARRRIAEFFRTHPHGRLWTIARPATGSGRRSHF